VSKIRHKFPTINNYFDEKRSNAKRRTNEMQRKAEELFKRTDTPHTTKVKINDQIIK